MMRESFQKLQTATIHKDAAIRWLAQEATHRRSAAVLAHDRDTASEIEASEIDFSGFLRGASQIGSVTVRTQELQPQLLLFLLRWS